MGRSNEVQTSPGVAGNARLTGGVAAALLVLLAAEGATIPFIGQLLGPHVFIGMLLIPPVLLKLGSTGYRFARYYSGNPAYVRNGPPNIALRVLAPGVVFTTLALFVTGVALLVAGPPSDTLKFAHKLSFIAWVALMGADVARTGIDVEHLKQRFYPAQTIDTSKETLEWLQKRMPPGIGS